MHYTYSLLLATSKTALVVELAAQERLADFALLRGILEMLNPATTTPLICAMPTQPYIAGIQRTMVLRLYHKKSLINQINNLVGLPQPN